MKVTLWYYLLQE